MQQTISFAIAFCATAVLHAAASAQPVLVRQDGRAVGNGHAFARGETCFVVTANHVVPHSRDFEVIDRRGTVAAAQVVKRFRQERDVDALRPGSQTRLDVLVARVNKSASFLCTTAWDSSPLPKEALAKAQDAGAALTAHHTRDDASAELQRLFLRRASDDELALVPFGPSDRIRPGDSGSFLSLPGDPAAVLVGMIIQVEPNGSIVALPHSWLNSLLVDVLREFGPETPGAVAMMAVDAANSTLERAAKGRDLAQYGQGAAIRALTGAKVSLAGRDLSGVLLKGLDLQGLDFSRAELRGSDVSGADFSRSTLSGAVLSIALMSKAVAREAQLEGTWGTFLDASGADFEGSNLTGARFYGARLQGAKLRSVSLRDAALPFADLRKADLRGAELSGAILAGALLADAEVEGAVFSNTDVTGAELPLARLTAAQVRGMCRTPSRGSGFELHWRVSVELTDPGTRGGSRFETPLDERAYAKTFPGFNLPLCKPRTAAQAELVLTSNDGLEHLHGYYAIRVEEGIARKAGALARLKRYIEERHALHSRDWPASQLVDLLPKDSTRVATMTRRASQAAPTVDALPFSGDTQMLLALAQEPGRLKENGVAFARQRLRFELALRDEQRREVPATLDRRYVDPWGDFFPDGLVPQEVDGEVASAHADWLARRVARLPSRLVVPAVYPDPGAPRGTGYPVLGGGMLGPSTRVEMYNYEAPQDLREDLRRLKLEHPQLMRLSGPNGELGLTPVVLAYPQPMVDYGIDISSLPAAAGRDQNFLLIHHRILKTQMVGGEGRTRWLLVYVEPQRVSAVKGTQEVWTTSLQRNDGGKLAAARTWAQIDAESRNAAATMARRSTAVERPAALPIGADTSLLYILAHEKPQGELPWSAMVREHLAAQSQLRRTPSWQSIRHLVWPWGELFPPEQQARDLSDADVGLFRSWTQERARQLPRVITVISHAGGGGDGPPGELLERRPLQHPQFVEGSGRLRGWMSRYTFEMKQLGADHHSLIEFPAPPAALGSTQVALALPRPIHEYMVKVPRRMLAESAPLTRWFAVDVAVTDVQVVRRDGEVMGTVVRGTPKVVRVVEGDKELWTASLSN